MHQGRSLTYRFAAAAPLWAGALADATPLPPGRTRPGRTRRLASGTLMHFAERGAPDERGLLTLGWYRPFLPVTQRYSGPASPYWASKAFLGLLLPEDHPVWTAPEEPAPVDVQDVTMALPAPGWLLHSTAADGIVRLVNHGSDRLPPPPATDVDSPHYARLAYSSATAPQTPGPDNQLALIAAEGTPSRRGRIRPLGAEGRRAASRYGDGIETVSVVHGPWEVRVHRIDSDLQADTVVREGVGPSPTTPRGPRSVPGRAGRWPAGPTD